MNHLTSVYSIVEMLKNSKIFHEITINRDGAITIMVTIPGERWEIDVFEDGEIDIEVFRSGGDIVGIEQLSKMIEGNAN